MINTSKIRAARETKGFSQELMADLLQISQSSYARMESGQQKIEAGQFFKIADELQIPAREFLYNNKGVSQKQNINYSSDINKQYYSIPKDLYDQHLNLMREMMEEIRKERHEFVKLIKLK